MILVSYQVFPGIQLIYKEAHIQSYTWDEHIKWSDNVFEITHCNEGRIEYSVNDEFCYLTSGDLTVTRLSDVSRTSYFPLCHYHGISVRIDADRAPKCLSCILEDVMVQPNALIKKFCENRNGFVARSNSSVEHIFSELYSIPKEIQKGYFKVKVLELLLFLSVFEPEQNELKERTYSRAQVTLAKSVAEYLMEHKDIRITLEELSQRFHVSGTQIKNSFKGVYGVSYYSYIRAQKMQSAAFMLEKTEKSILEIAGAHGYDNGSKFASAFRSIMGMSPNEYRNEKRNV